LSNGYNSSLQIDRKDNNGNYTPNNCHFCSSIENGNNTRKSRRWIVFNKEFVSAKKAGEYNNVSRKTIWSWCGVGKQANKKVNCSAIKKYKEK